jgi:hypothetical protein
MRWKADLPKMPRLPTVPLDAAGGPAMLGPPPSPSAYRERNPVEAAPAEYQAPSVLVEHKGIALLFLGAAIAFALYCWKAPRSPAPQRSVALDGSPQTAVAAGGETARTRTSEVPQSPIYVETLPDKER